MTLRQVLKDSLFSIGTYFVGFILFLAGFLYVLDYFGFKYDMASSFSLLDDNTKLGLIFVLSILISLFLFALIVYIISNIVSEIENPHTEKTPKSKPK